ncbi:hypothetical protein, partial [Reyranella soli]|uniref:hypothetical protein n=1 Tax=Reyranella soli TaxID=1230389 RepID=UPI001C3F9546
RSVGRQSYLTAEQRRKLGRKSNLMGALLVAHAWALIGASMALFAAGSPRAARRGLPGKDGAAAGLPDDVAARDLAARRFDRRTALRRQGPAHLTKKGGPLDRPRCLVPYFY